MAVATVRIPNESKSLPGVQTARAGHGRIIIDVLDMDKDMQYRWVGLIFVALLLSVGCQQELGIDQENFACDQRRPCGDGYECVSTDEFGKVCRPQGGSSDAGESDGALPGDADASPDAEPPGQTSIRIFPNFDGGEALGEFRVYRFDGTDCEDVPARPADDLGVQIDSEVDGSSERLALIVENIDTSEADQLFVIGMDKTYPVVERAIGCVSQAQVAAREGGVDVELVMRKRFAKLEEQYVLVSQFDFSQHPEELASIGNLYNLFDALSAEGSTDGLEAAEAILEITFKALAEADEEVASRYGFMELWGQWEIESEDQERLDMYRNCLMDNAGATRLAPQPWSELVPPMLERVTALTEVHVETVRDALAPNDPRIAFDFHMNWGNFEAPLPEDFCGEHQCEASKAEFWTEPFGSVNTTTQMTTSGELTVDMYKPGFSLGGLAFSLITQQLMFTSDNTNRMDLSMMLYDMWDCETIGNTPSCDSSVESFCDHLQLEFEGVARFWAETYVHSSPVRLVAAEPSECHIIEPSTYPEDGPSMLPVAQHIGQQSETCRWEVSIENSTSEADFYSEPFNDCTEPDCEG